MRRGVLGAVGLAAAAAVLTGCSQVDSLAAVSGDKPVTVRVAAIDVLLREKVQMLQAPVCRQVDKTLITCEGTTTSHEKIAVTSTGTAPLMMKLTVGARTLYEGDAQTVVDAAAEVGQ